MEILVLLFTILYAFFSWRRLDLATALLVVFLPFYQVRLQAEFLPMTLLELMILVIFSTWFIKSWKSGKLPLLNSKLKGARNYPFYVEIILVLIAAFVSVIISGFSNASLGILKAYFIEPLMFFIVFVNVFKIKESRNKIFWALAVSAFIISCTAIYQKITGNLMPLEYAESGRVTGVFAYPNALGLYLGPVVIILAGWLFKIINDQLSVINQFSKIFFVVISIALSVVAIFLAKSEGALAGIAAALLFLGLIYNKRSRWITAGIAVLAVVGLIASSPAREYAINKVMLRDLDGQIRRQIWQETWEMLTDSPFNFIFGAGLANYQDTVALYHQEGIFVRDYGDPDWRRKVVWNNEYKAKVWQPLEIYLYPHNLLLNFWSELGLAGMLLFIWIIGKFLVISYRILVIGGKNKGIALGLAGAMAVIAAHGLVDVPYFKNDLAVVFWMLIAMTGILSLQINESYHKSTNRK